MKSCTKLQNQRQNVKVSKHQPVTVNYGKNLPQNTLGTIDKEVKIHIFYRQLDFSSEPGVAKEILEKEPKSCLAVA